MSSALFLLCPTDRLESIINKEFKSENYFYTSLGNSFDINYETLTHLKKIVLKHDIRKIYFVLSDDNEIIFDALKGQLFSDIKGLKAYRDQILSQKQISNIFWQNDNDMFSVISYYLNRKINELYHELHNSLRIVIKISGKIYNRNINTFEDIHPTLICLEHYCLN